MITPISTTLANTAMKSTTIGLKLFAMTHFMAQGTPGSDASFTSAFGSVLYILNLVGLTLAFGGLLFAAVMFMMGQTERMIYGLVGAVIGGMSWLIVKTMFTQSGASVSINMGTTIS